MTRILLVSGSTREESLHTAALRTATGFLPATLFDGLRGLPAFVPGEPVAPEAVTGLRDLVTAADVLLFSTPEYAGSLPGSLKNLLDWLVAGGDLHDKPVAWLSLAPPGQDEGARAALESALAHGNARLLNWACARIPLALSAVGADGLIGDPQLHRAIQDIGQALDRFLAVPKARKQPSWQAYSSVFPVIGRPDTSAYDRWRAQS
jgi:chromate reductase